VLRARFIETRFDDLTEGGTTEQAQGEWLDATRRRATIRVLLPQGASIDPPFPPR
jgi:hypothetical protein